MLLSSGHFPLYRTEPAVFDLLVPRFGSLRSIRRRRKLLNVWLRSKQFRISGLQVQEIKEQILNECQTGGDFLRIVMDGIARNSGLQRWVVWGPDNLLCMPTIKNEIPEALFIHIIRDGRDVAVAVNRAGFIRPLPFDYQEKLLIAGSHWMWKVKKGREYSRPIGSDYIEVSYERLVTRPEETLAQLSCFLGQNLDYKRIRQTAVGAVSCPNSSFVEELCCGRFSPIGRWKRQLSNRQIENLEALLGPTLVELGYTLSIPPTATRNMAAEIVRAVYPCFFDLKQYLKLNTPFGRCVSLERLELE
jgi:Sulfotransferase family